MFIFKQVYKSERGHEFISLFFMLFVTQDVIFLTMVNILIFIVPINNKKL